MNKKRLLKLADLLEADAKNRKGIKFDLGTWGYVDDDSKGLVSCGTTACAMGLAAISGAFKRQGLSHKLEGNYIVVMHDGKEGGFSAACNLFGIEYYEARSLFDSEHYPMDVETVGAAGERYVAKRIRDFVAGKFVP